MDSGIDKRKIMEFRGVVSRSRSLIGSKEVRGSRTNYQRIIGKKEILIFNIFEC